MKQRSEKQKYNKIWLILCVGVFAVISAIFADRLFNAEINNSENPLLLSNSETVPYVDEKLYLYIKEIYENTNWDIQCSQGDESKFIPYKEQFIKLLNEECCFVDSQGGEQTLSHFGEIDMADPDYDPSHFSYYFYDVDGDGTPELGMTDNQRFLYIIKYEEQADRFILWDEYYLGMSLMGTGKIEWSGTQGDTGMMERTQDGNYIFKVRFLVEGNAKSDNAGDDVWSYFVALPDDIELEEWMLPQAKFKDVIYANYFFRVTKEQYEELSEPFYEAVKVAYEKKEDVFYSYEELVNSTWSKEIKIKQMIVGKDYFLALYDDGSVWSWGNNDEGKLGIAQSFVLEPQRIEGLEQVVKLEDGGENVFALTEQGDVYTWGVKENVIPMKPVDSSAHIDTPFMMQNLKNIADITAENGKLYALNKDGSLYVSDYPWVYGSFTNFLPLQEDVMLGEIGHMQAGAGNYDYFVRTDGSIFSLMSFFYEGYDSNAYAFIFPHEGEAAPGKNDVIAWPPLPEDVPEIAVLNEGGKYECLIYYELEGVENVKAVSSDPYTVFLSKKDGALYYWNSDRIKYHDKAFVLTQPDTLREQCNGEFVEIRVEDILDIDDTVSEYPQIISLKSGKENTMFLTDDGRVFISKYVTYDTADVEYGLWQVANPGRDPQTDTYYDMALKELTFQKLELTDIQSIWTNGENCFCAVDSESGYYRIVTEDNQIAQTYLGLLPEL